MKLSDHFTLAEMVFSQTAIRKQLDNTPDQVQIENLKKLCTEVLEHIRVLVGKPIQVTSGYRSKKVNRAVGGSRTSQHQQGEAADIQVKGLTTQELFDIIIKSDLIQFDQIIQEFDEWVHISFSSKKNRRSILYARHSTTKGRFVIYYKSLS